jgi:hypothetical protein
MPEDESVTVEETEEKIEPEKASAPRKTVTVKVIAEKDGSALVEWVERDDLHRCYLPADEVATGKASKEALGAGIPYGIAWEDHLGDLPKSMARTLGAELRRRGVWCKEDLTNARAVKHAIGKAVGNIYTLLKAAAQEV